MSRGVKYTPSQLEFLRINWPTMQLAELTEAFNVAFGSNRTPEAIKRVLSRHRLRSGRCTRFLAGRKPWNTGTKGLTGANSKSFQPGNVPANTKLLGHERISKGGHVEVKVAEPNPYTGAPTRYKFKHLIVWEAVHGPVPPGHVLRFVDGDKSNCALENLEMLSRAEHLRLTQLGYDEAPTVEAKTTTMLIAKLDVKAFQAKRGWPNKRTDLRGNQQ